MNLVVFISGNGSNLQSIIDNGIKIDGVVSSDSDAYGIIRARKANIPILDITEIGNPDLIVLAGYMKILSKEFVEKHNIINIHPSLLPKYKGLNTHQRALNDSKHGMTIHKVVEELDSGEIIFQNSIRVYNFDDEESLKNRVLELEHKWYPIVIKRIIKEIENDRN